MPKKLIYLNEPTDLDLVFPRSYPVLDVHFVKGVAAVDEVEFASARFQAYAQPYLDAGEWSLVAPAVPEPKPKPKPKPVPVVELVPEPKPVRKTPRKPSK